jgi:predicted RNA-binding protein with PIN domain
LDGYNIIKQTSSLNRGTLENQRQSLLNWINRFSPQGSSKNSVTVVFDGKDEFFGSHESYPIKVIFSKGQSADDLIKNIVDGHPLKKSLVVVSNDKDIKLYVRALGAGVLSVKEFMMEVLPKERLKKSGKPSSTATSKYISLTDQAKINKEFERIWGDSKESKG